MTPTGRPPRTETAGLFARLRALRLLVVTGKGGVGKSAVSAALGTLLARRGGRVLVLEVDPRENVHQMLGVPPSGGEIVEALPGLFLQNLQPRAVLDEAVRDHVRIGPIVTRVLRSPVYQHFADAAPGLKEIAVLAHALRLVEGAWGRRTVRVDTVVLDAPATGHGVSLLAAPTLASDVIRQGPFGRIAAELSAFVADPDRCGVVITAAAEEMPVQEAIESLAMLADRLGREPQLLVVNGVYPRPSASQPRTRLEALWHRRRRVNDEELGRLRQAWSGPLVELPLLPLERGPGLTAELAAQLAAGLGDDR